MGKRIALLIGAITVIATIIGLAADLQDLIGGGDGGADLVVEDFSASMENNSRSVNAEVTVHNQGGEAAEDVSVKVVVTEDGTGETYPSDERSAESIVADSSRTFNFNINVQNAEGGNTLRVKAQVFYNDDTIESSTVQLDR